MNGARATADIVEKPTSTQSRAVQNDGPAGNNSHRLSVWYKLFRCLHSTSFEFWDISRKKNNTTAKCILACEAPGLQAGASGSLIRWQLRFTAWGQVTNRMEKMYHIVPHVFQKLVSISHVLWLSLTPCACRTCPMQLSAFVKSQARPGTSLLTWKPAQWHTDFFGSPHHALLVWSPSGRVRKTFPQG